MRIFFQVYHHDSVPSQGLIQDLIVCSHVIAGLCVCLFVTFIYLSPMEDQMAKVKEALCGGKTDFVIGTQVSTGLLWLSPENSRIRSSLNKGVLAVRSVIEKGSISNNDYARTVTDAEAMAHILDLPPSHLMYLNGIAFCVDVDLDGDSIETQLPGFASASLTVLRARTLVEYGKNCQDFKDYCSSPWISLLRVLCPVTCECGIPARGLYLSGPSAGCDRDMCRKSQKAQLILEALDCEDDSVQSLQNNPHWDAYWTQYVEYWDPRGEQPLYRSGKLLALRSGCDWPGIQLYCRSSEYFATIHPFCPKTCGCHLQNSYHPDCPHACIELAAQETSNGWNEAYTDQMYQLFVPRNETSLITNQASGGGVTQTR
jgi:hypothetical protein